jgi:polyphosphate kinase 2 (PPK2 family)
MSIGREMQLKRFHERRHNPLKLSKLSPVDYAAMTKWDAYSKACKRMLKATHTDDCPWTIVLANDKRRARLSIIRHLLDAFEYPGRDDKVVGQPDKRILGGPKLLKGVL